MSTALTFTRYCYRYPLSFCTFALPPVHCNYGRMGCERGDVRLIYTELRAAVRVTVLYNRCGCVYDIKDCVRSLQAQTTAVQNEWKERERIEGKNGDKRGPLFGVGLLCSCFSSHYSSSLPFSLFSLRTVWCVFATRTGWPICALSFSLFLLILLKETENDEQTVRCEGCIIVRIIRAAKKNRISVSDDRQHSNSNGGAQFSNCSRSLFVIVVVCLSFPPACFCYSCA